MERLPSRVFVELAYNIMLRRPSDPEGLQHYRRQLRRGEVSRLGMLDVMRGSDEFRVRVTIRDLLTSLHQSRCEFVRSLPRARRILDIGGTHQQNREGAFVHMLYRYPFDELVIRDLPHEQRHELYQHSDVVERVQTPLGPVSYSYGSMADLSQFADASFDGVYCGQSIEHVTPEDCDLTLKEVSRVLAPGGWFALDTPNGPVCRLEKEELINPDHKVEYSHDELLSKLKAAGFDVVDIKGLNYIGRPAKERVFVEEDVARNVGMYAEIEDCYLLAYVCRKPV